MNACPITKSCEVRKVTDQLNSSNVLYKYYLSQECPSRRNVNVQNKTRIPEKIMGHKSDKISGEAVP